MLKIVLNQPTKPTQNMASTYPITGRFQYCVWFRKNEFWMYWKNPRKTGSSCWPVAW